MEHVMQATFGDVRIQNEERYKKLQRTLKLASLKKGLGTKEDTWPLPMTSPSTSMITVDHYDNSAKNSPTAYGNGSEIVSFSNNLRNVFFKKKSGTNATSSVRRGSPGGERDSLLMPPPNLPHFEYAVDESAKRKNDQFRDNHGVYAFNHSRANSNNFVNRSVEIFINWKVILNERRELLVKGTLMQGANARSKPISRRLTSTDIESIYKHVYHLEGHLVDNEHELPDYIKGKFYNGFPDDWENVHKIWKTYVKGGCKKTFRWPTPITDSDDDLRSEVTDMTYLRSPVKKQSNLSFSKDVSACKTSLNCEGTLQTKEKQNVNPCTKKSDSFTQTSSLDITRENQALTTCNNKENSEERKNLNLIDRFNNILNSLKRTNCEECFNKVVDMFECFVSHGLIKDNESSINDSKLENSGHTIQKSNRVSSASAPSVHSETIPLQKTLTNDIKSHVNSLSRKRTFEEMDGDKKNSSDDESEIYTGIPKIPIERIMRQRETALIRHKSKLRKTGTHKYDISKGHNSSKTNVANESYVKPSSDIDCNVSSVSIIEDEKDYSRRRENCMRPYVSSDIESDNKKRGYKNKNQKEQLHDSENGQREFIAIRKDDARAVETNKENQKTNDQHQDQLSSQESYPGNKTIKEVTKPVIISVTPVNFNIKSNKCLTRDDKIYLLEEQENNINELNGNRKVMNNSAQKANVLTAQVESKSKISKTLQQNNLKVSKPRKLSAWTPRVLYKSELCLIFEGKLLNELGHIENRQFKTDAIINRVSEKVVETINHEFYELIGDMSTKHAVPKQLLNHCRYGCPARIEEFCKTWKLLETDKRFDALNISVSSKGRKILSPLSYWMGERVVVKNDNMVYSPGKIQGTLVSTSPEKNKPRRKIRKVEDTNSENSPNQLVQKIRRSTRNRKTAQTSSDSSDEQNVKTIGSRSQGARSTVVDNLIGNHSKDLKNRLRKSEEIISPKKM